MEPLGDEDLIDAAPLDRDVLLLVEVGLQPVEGPRAERQAESLRVGQRRGDDLGDLLGRVGRRASGAGLILQSVRPLGVEPLDPGIYGGPGDAGSPGCRGGAEAVGDSEDDLGPLDESSLGRARAGQGFDGLALLGRQDAEGEFGRHGAPPLEGLSPLLSRLYVNHLGGCTN